MTNKDKFMNNARKRLSDKAYKARKATQEAIQTRIEGYERCAKGR
ncbi:hypothetical protein [Candidatus Clostridium radicumherbarum]|uniref:Uncharacterized protein n=1 Tax=Candidatus Clostridium radicumherbarum TaxID=3381662 RepID=A0ABW8TPX3_9CLOT